MSHSALILAAHGSRDDPSADVAVYRHAEVLAGCTPFDRVTVAFHCKEPSMASVLRRLTAFDVTVVPFMTSEGYFTTRVLPHELSKSRWMTHRLTLLTPPVGTHLGIASIVARRVRHQLQRFNLCPSSTSLAIVGHGTRRCEQSRLATVDLAATLHRERVCREAFPAFLEEGPDVRTITNRAQKAAIVVVPFMMACGRHVTRDIPEALGLMCSTLPGVVACGKLKNRFVVCDAPIGVDPGIVEIVADLVRAPEVRAFGEVA
jgi:sirohydrochlorin cobaltochelatase